MRCGSRAPTRTSSLGGGPLRYGRGWAIGAWFVPILNVFRPKQMANDIWRGSDPDLPRLIVTNASLGPGAWSPDTVEELRTQSIQYLVPDVTDVGAAMLCAAVVGRTARRQEERARRVEAVAAATATV